MYNPQRIIQLLEDRGLKNKDLLDFIGKNWNGSLQQVVNGDIRVSKLEKIADFFQVSIDEFFDRNISVEGVYSSVSNNHLHHINVGMTDKCRSLERIIAEKDARIATLEEMVAILKSTKNV